MKRSSPLIKLQQRVLRKRTNILILSLLALGFTLTGCFNNCYRSHPYSLYQTDLSKNVARAIETQAVSIDPFYYEAWWDFFQDPQLSRLIESGLECHPDIQIADARIRLACNVAKIKRSALFPHLFGIGEINRQKISELAPGFFPGAPSVFSEATLELAAFYELDIWKKNRSLFHAALDRMQASIADFEEAKLLLSTAIAAFYFDLQVKLARINVNRSRLKAREELYNLHRQQFDLGVTSEFRLYQTHTDVQFIKDLILRLEREVALDEHAISALVGNTGCGPCGELVLMPAAVFKTSFPLPASLPIDLLARRPDITARKWLVEAACYDIKAAQAEFFPRIDLMGLLGFQSINLSQLFTGKALVVLGEATATLPIFLAGKLQGQLGVARETFEIAIQEYNQTVLNAVQDVSDALSDLVISDERSSTIRLAVRDAKELVDLTEQKYNNAIYSKIALLNSMENLYVQEDLETQIQLARFESAVKLIRAIGGGYYECAPR